MEVEKQVKILKTMRFIREVESMPINVFMALNCIESEDELREKTSIVLEQLVDTAREFINSSDDESLQRIITEQSEEFEKVLNENKNLDKCRIKLCEKIDEIASDKDLIISANIKKTDRMKNFYEEKIKSLKGHIEELKVRLVTEVHLKPGSHAAKSYCRGDVFGITQ